MDSRDTMIENQKTNRARKIEEMQATVTELGEGRTIPEHTLLALMKLRIEGYAEYSEKAIKLAEQDGSYATEIYYEGQASENHQVFMAYALAIELNRQEKEREEEYKKNRRRDRRADTIAARRALAEAGKEDQR